MKQSLIELVDVILRRIQEQPERAKSESGLRKWLAGQGYKKRDIDAAMKLVGARIAPEQMAHQSQPGPNSCLGGNRVSQNDGRGTGCFEPPRVLRTDFTARARGYPG